jgi:hypothetical protein
VVDAFRFSDRLHRVSPSPKKSLHGRNERRARA